MARAAEDLSGAQATRSSRTTKLIGKAASPTGLMAIASNSCCRVKTPNQPHWRSEIAWKNANLCARSGLKVIA